MKGFIKLTTVALALVAFASCSSDDFFSSDNVQKKNFTSVLEANVEDPDFGVVTRAARKADATGFRWQTDDQIRVYDTDLGKYDVYEYDETFGRDGDTNLEKDPAYALFPAENIKRGYWDPTDGHVAEVVIPRVIEYSKTSGAETKLEDGTVLYKMFVPMQGKVSKVDDATVKVNDPGMQVMTGVLYATLEQALGNADFIKLSSATTNLSGRFLAKLDDDNATLIESDDELIAASYNQDLYVDLRNLPSDKAVLYIPVIAGVNDLQVSRIHGVTTVGADGIPTDGTTVLITNLDTYTFKRNGYKGVPITYDLAANTPSGINAVLAQYNEQTSPVTLNVYNNFTIATADKTIELPAMACSEVTLNLSAGVTNATPDDLVLEDADSEDPFTGTLVINVNAPKKDGSAATALTAGNLMNMVINLPKAKVVLVGDYTPVTAASLTVTAVDELQFGDGETTTAYNQATLNLSNVASKITVEKKATVTATTSITATTAELEVKADATNPGTIAGSGAIALANDATIAGAVTGVITSTAGELTVSGTVTGDITLVDDLTISGTVTGDITTKGNVTIARTSEGTAIGDTNTLTFKRAKTLTMKQGYIGTVTNKFDELGEADGHIVTITFDEDGLTAIKAVTVDASNWADSKINLSNASKWVGAAPTTAKINAFIGVVSTYSQIFTAAQLASFQGTDAAVKIQLQNNINMNSNEKFTAPIGNGASAAAVEVDGNEFAISNVNLNKLAYNSKGIGLIGYATTLTVSDLTLDNVQFTKGYVAHSTAASAYMIAAVGGLCGTASGAVDLDNVTVNLADGFGYSSYATGGTGAVVVDATEVGIGGVIGIAEGNVDFDNVDVTGAQIQGYTSLGGFIGLAKNTVDIDAKCSSAITGFKVNYNDPAATNIEMNLARIAGGVGYQATATSDITIAAGATTSEVAISGDNYIEGKLYISVPTAGGARLYSYAKNQNWVGFCGTENTPAAYTGTVFVGTTQYVSPTFNATTGAVSVAAGKTGLYTWTAKAN